MILAKQKVRSVLPFAKQGEHPSVVPPVFGITPALMQPCDRSPVTVGFRQNLLLVQS